MIDEDITGWTGGLEAYYLEIVESLPNGASFVEVGVYVGKSLIHAATEARRLGKAIRFYAVDHFRGSPEHHKDERLSGLDRLRQTFESNLAQHNIEATILEGESALVARGFAYDSLDFVFLDASHDYASVCQDIRAWLPRTRILAGHDHEADWPDVARAVKDLLGQVRIVGTCWEYRK